MRLCARCLGIVAGVAMSWTAIPWREHLIGVTTGACLLLAADGLTQLIGLRSSTNFLRFTTGFAAGLLVPAFLLTLI